MLAEGRRRLSQLGLVVGPLSPERAEQLGFTREIAGELGFLNGEEAVAVLEIDADGPAASKGIRQFDIITEIDRERVVSAENLLEVVSVLEAEKSALFWIWRAGRGIDVRALKIQGN